MKNRGSKVVHDVFGDRRLLTRLDWLIVGAQVRADEISYNAAPPTAIPAQATLVLNVYKDMGILTSFLEGIEQPSAVAAQPCSLNTLSGLPSQPEQAVHNRFFNDWQYWLVYRLISMDPSMGDIPVP